MDDEQSRRVDALLRLYKEQMEHFRHTQDIEWKANFGIWTLLAAAIYIVVVAKEPVGIHRGWLVPVFLGFAVALHGSWLFMVHCSEVADKKFWTSYRADALRMVSLAHKDEEPWKRQWWQELLWLALEVGVTFLLCVFLFYSLPR